MHIPIGEDEMLWHGSQGRGCSSRGEISGDQILKLLKLFSEDLGGASSGMKDTSDFTGMPFGSVHFLVPKPDLSKMRNLTTEMRFKKQRAEEPG